MRGREGLRRPRLRPAAECPGERAPVTHLQLQHLAEFKFKGKLIFKHLKPFEPSEICLWAGSCLRCCVWIAGLVGWEGPLPGGDICCPDGAVDLVGQGLGVGVG